MQAHASTRSNLGATAPKRLQKEPKNNLGGTQKLIALYAMSLVMKMRVITKIYSNFDMHTVACACMYK